MYRELFKRNLVSLSLNGCTKQEIFKEVAKQLVREGIVTEGYLAALQEREQAFPTGLITKHLNIALPHAEPAYIKKPFVYIARSVQSVSFSQMGDGQEMFVKDYFFLGIMDAKAQVGLLQRFMNLFMDDQFVKRYQQCQREHEAYALFYDNMST